VASRAEEEACMSKDRDKIKGAKLNKPKLSVKQKKLKKKQQKLAKNP
jgi:hypothetical protein